MAHFVSAQDAEDAFYDAFEAGDLDAIMSVWAEGEIICIHPMGPALFGREAVAESWNAIFASTRAAQPDITIHHRHWREEGALAIHLCEVDVRFPNSPPNLPPSLVTHIYRQEEAGWQLIHYHVSPPPARTP